MLKKVKTNGKIVASLLWLAIASCFVEPTMAAAAADQTFDVFQVGTTVYSNVTVTTKAKRYIFILHQGGMANIPLSDLSPELRAQLGYEPPPPPKEPVKDATVWAKKELATIETPAVKEVEAKLNETWKTQFGEGVPKLTKEVKIWLGSFLVGALLIYLFFCYCGALICKKAGAEPSALIWVPILQAIPLLRAAEMSAGWFLVLLLPVLNIIVYVIWCSNIARARNKGILTFTCLVLPLINFFAFLYLAFSDSQSKKQPVRSSSTLTLEAV
jgi:hypothetical protein